MARRKPTYDELLEQVSDLQEEVEQLEADLNEANSQLDSISEILNDEEDETE